MGSLISYFRRKEPSYEELIEDIERDLQLAEERKRNTEIRERVIIGNVVFYLIVFYLCVLGWIYLYWMPKQYRSGGQGMSKVVLVGFFLLFPVFVFYVRKALLLYFARVKKLALLRIDSLKAEKKQKLEESKQKLTYNQAKGLLDRFDEEAKKQKKMKEQEAAAGAINGRKGGGGQFNASQAGMRKREVAGSGGKNNNNTNQQQQRMTGAGNVGGSPGGGRMMGASSQMGTPVQTPRPVLDANRSRMDKVVDFLVGDGPSNRYALICAKCYSHNGMALEEEFEYLAFRCAYCAHMNPARKQRTVDRERAMMANMNSGDGPMRPYGNGGGVRNGGSGSPSSGGQSGGNDSRRKEAGVVRKLQMNNSDDSDECGVSSNVSKDSKGKDKDGASSE
eukprot:Nk52_evm1s934 gene=Nk52_evmTU1s934